MKEDPSLFGATPDPELGLDETKGKNTDSHYSANKKRQPARNAKKSRSFFFLGGLAMILSYLGGMAFSWFLMNHSMFTKLFKF